VGICGIGVHVFYSSLTFSFAEKPYKDVAENRILPRKKQELEL
jgi:hypothetical protein